MPRSGIHLYGAVVLSFVIPTDCDFLISLNGLLWMERASLLLNNHPVPWQRSSLLHHPLLFVIPSEAEGSAVRSMQYRRVRSKGAPGLAFETWDPSNQFPLETPTLFFVIPSDCLNCQATGNVPPHA
jgi:hypothetical protein